MPVICDLADIPTPELTDGISFLPELTGKEQKQHEYLYWEFYQQDKKQAARKG